VRDLCKVSAGSLSGIIEKLVVRSKTIKKTKQAVSSIWENTFLTGKGVVKGRLMDNSINDLNYLLTLNTNENINNGNFYANENVNDEVEVKLFSE
jgi:hypothetical protein